MTALKAARSWGVRPTEYLATSAPGSVWGDRDRGLAEALIAYEDSLCGGCGYPRLEAWDERNEGEFEAEAHVCQACKTRDVRAKDRKPVAGEHVTINRVPPN